MSYEEQLPLPSAPIPDIGEIVADAPAVPAQADDDAATVERILTASATDPTAYLAKESLDAFRRIRESDSVEYERVRTLLKSANPKIRVVKLDELTQAAGETARGSDSLASRLTDLAVERAMRHGIKLVRVESSPPPKATYSPSVNLIAAYPHEPNRPSNPAPLPVTPAATDAELVARIRAAVLARLDGQVDAALLDAVIAKVLAGMR